VGQVGRGHKKGAEGGVADAPSTNEASRTATPTPFYGTSRVRGRSPAQRQGPGRPPRITGAELTALAVAQIFMGIPNDNQFLALARYRLGHLFPFE
jgi:hypothetical protein